MAFGLLLQGRVLGLGLSYWTLSEGVAGRKGGGPLAGKHGGSADFQKA